MQLNFKNTQVDYIHKCTEKNFADITFKRIEKQAKQDLQDIDRHDKTH